MISREHVQAFRLLADTFGKGDLKHFAEKLQTEFEKMKADADLRKTIELDGPYVWQTIDGTRHGPYCGVCWGKHKTLLPISPHGGLTSRTFCANCNTVYARDELFGRLKRNKEINEANKR